jgi:hypothetical protein
MDEDRRRNTRHVFRCRVEVGRLKGERADSTAPAFVGEVVNVSQDGMCVTGDRSVERYAVAPWRFYLPGVPVTLPVLAQVRWVESPADPERGLFHLGLLFLT